MADIIDLANERADEILEDAIARKKPEGPKPIGKCHNCADPLNNEKRFCDSDCRDDWEMRESRKKQQFVDGIEKEVDDFEY